MTDASCEVADCGRLVSHRGLCNRHYLRWRRHGDPLAGGKFLQPIPTEPAGTKFCTRCGSTKSLGEFYPDRRCRHGVSVWCRSCVADGNAARDKAAMAASARAYVARDPAAAARRYRKHNLKRHYGLTVEQYEVMVAAQGGRCAICGEPETTKATDGVSIRALAVDHDHETGVVRGLLCGRCNVAIGYLRSSPELLQRAIDYLAKQALDSSDSAAKPPLVGP